MPVSDVSSLAPQPIPAPPNFPIQWQSGEEWMFWTWDRMHFPEVLTPLDAEWILDMHNKSFNVPLAALGLPMRMHGKVINGYMFTSMAPITTNMEELHTAEEQAQAKLGEAMGALGQRWDHEYLPELQRHLQRWDQFDLRAADMPALRAHVDETVAMILRCWEIHFFVAFPMLLSISLFDELYRDLFGNETAFDAYKLLQGIRTKSVEAGHALWDLSRKAIAVPDVRKVMEEEAASQVIPALQRSDAGRRFLSDLHGYLGEYGQRADKFTTNAVSWIEDPTPAIKMLKDYCGRSEGNPEEELKLLAEERDQLIAVSRQRLAGYPQQVVGQFEFMLGAAQVGNRLQEDHNFWIDQRVMYRMRKVFLEVGRRLVDAGVIADAGDVYYLTLSELRETIDAFPTLNRYDIVAQHKAAEKQQQALQPPPMAGAIPPGAPPDNPMIRTMGKFWGAPPQGPTAEGVLRGNAGSPGIMRGPARIIKSIAESGKLQPGDVLVAETTAPPWTPLFATAAAVVTDTGGILSHCAIVAREYRIPAVVGIGMATTMLRDGQLVEVDGNAGTVRPLVTA